MPKTQLDWLGVISLWAGALVMAFKAGDLPLAAGARNWLTANWWDYVPICLVTIYLLIVLHRHFRPVELSQPLASKPSSAADIKEANRRRLITAGRKLVAKFNRQSQHQHLMDFLQRQDDWHSIRPHLSPEVLRDMTNSRLAVATSGEVKDGKVYYLTSELERLEREWSLV